MGYSELKSLYYPGSGVDFFEFKEKYEWIYKRDFS